VDLQPLPFDAPVERYAEQAARLLAAQRAGEREALRYFHQQHPRFREAALPWLPRRDVSADELRRAVFDLDDARLALARGHDFQDWARLEEHARALAQPDGAVLRFVRAVEAVIEGELAALAAALRAHPELVRARSTRVTPNAPPVHRATLLHYLAANGVEGRRQRSPRNAADVARLLLREGAEPDALAGFYGGEHATLSLLVSSTPPAQAGVQVALVDALVDGGASVEPVGSDACSAPLATALAFGFLEAAEALVRHGARVDSLPLAAGLGRLEQAARLLPGADAASRHRALALATQLGQVEVVRLLLDAGEDPDRYNPAGLHAHGTPLHHAVAAGREAVVRLLVERGARLDLEDTLYHATPLGWAEYLGQAELARYLRTRGAR